MVYRNSKNTGIANFSNTCRLVAPAKLNLGLKLVGRRPDGYHELESLFWPINLADEISVAHASHPNLTFCWTDDSKFRAEPLPSETDNTVEKILRAIGMSDSFSIHIRKRIPIGSGLGGGSSDAAAVLKYLWKNHSSNLMRIAMQVGADVPFFLKPEPAWVEGVGEWITYLPSASSWNSKLTFILVIPNLTISTKFIFDLVRNSSFKFSKTRHDPPNIDTFHGFVNYLQSARNDLESFVTSEYPVIGHILTHLRELDMLFAGLSGTGSTCFAVIDKSCDVMRLTQEIEQSCRALNCKFIITTTYGIKSHNGR